MAGALEDIPSQYLNVLDSNDLSAANQVKELILEHLKGSSKDHWIIVSLVEYYCRTQSNRCLDLLLHVREPSDKVLLDKCHDLLKGAHRLQVLMLLGHMVRVQVPWLHRLVQHSLMGAIVKIFKTETDVPILMTALLFITCYLPSVPISMSSFMQEIFEAFSRLAGYDLEKHADIPRIYLIHLRAGIYCLFVRLYGMYPCHLLTYLRTVYARQDRKNLFDETITPFLERCRMHPLLVTSSRDKEISKERWTKKEVHDIVQECAGLCLDPIEGSTETVQFPLHSSGLEQDAVYNIAAIKQAFPEIETEIMDLPLDSLLASYKADNLYKSPAERLGIDTPPGQASSSSVSKGSTSVTPARWSVASELQQQDKETKPKARHQSGLRLSLGTTSTTQGSSVPESPSQQRKEFGAYPSAPPLTADSVKFSHPFGEFSASGGSQPLSALSVQWDDHSMKSSGTVKPDVGTKGVMARTGQSTGATDTGVPPNVLAAALKQISDDVADSAQTSKLKVSREPAKSEQFFPPKVLRETSVASGPTSGVFPISLTDKATNTNLATSEFSRQTASFKVSASTQTDRSEVGDRRASDNSRSVSVSSVDDVPSGKGELTSTPESKMAATHGTDVSPAKDKPKIRVEVPPPEQPSMETSVKAASRLKTPPVVIQGDTRQKLPEDTARHSRSVPTVTELPDFMETCEIHLGDIESELLEVGTDSSSSLGTTPGHLPLDMQLTADSIREFMKNVHRIRFQSMNAPTTEQLTARSVESTTLMRSHSCPDIKELEEAEEAGILDLRVSRKDSVSSRGSIKLVESSKSSVMGRSTNSSSVTVVEHTATIASQTSFVSPKGFTSPDQFSSGQVELVFPPVPYAHMLTEAIPFSPFLSCPRCQSIDNRLHPAGADLPQDATDKSVSFNLGGGTRESTPELMQILKTRKDVSQLYFSVPTPMQVLDEEMAACVSQHSVKSPQQLLPQPKPTSKSGHNKTDQQLQGELQLAHTQLLYERTKRDLLSERNRRLHARLTKASGAEEQCRAREQCLRLQEVEILHQQETVKQLQQELKEAKSARDAAVQGQLQTARKYEEEMEKLRNNNLEMQKEMEQQRTATEELHKEVVVLKAELVRDKHHAVGLSEKASVSNELQKQVEQLRNELLLMGELQQKYQQRMTAVTHSHPNQKLSMQLETYKNQLNSTKQKLDNLSMNYDIIKDKLHHSEKENKEQEARLEKLLKAEDSLKKLQKHKVESLNETIETQRKIQQGLEAQLLELNAKLYSQLKFLPLEQPVTHAPGHAVPQTSSHSMPATPVSYGEEASAE